LVLSPDKDNIDINNIFVALVSPDILSVHNHLPNIANYLPPLDPSSIHYIIPPPSSSLSNPLLPNAMRFNFFHHLKFCFFNNTNFGSFKNIINAAGGQAELIELYSFLLTYYYSFLLKRRRTIKIGRLFH
jgi:hypothetical protein